MTLPPAIDAQTAFTGTVEPEGDDRLDTARLTAWMEANVAGFAGPLAIAKFKGGQSNPTYLIDAPSGRYVLRRKPFGPLLPSAHAVDREYRVRGRVEDCREELFLFTYSRVSHALEERHLEQGRELSFLEGL